LATKDKETAVAELAHYKTELGKLSIEYETLQNSFDMM